MAKQTWIVAIVIIILLAGAWYYQTNKPVPATSEPIKVGVVYGLTGAASTWTEYGVKALEMATEEINNDGGVNSRPLKLIIDDSQTNPARSVSGIQKLISVDGAKVIVGDVWSFITNPLIPIAEQRQVVVISPTVMDASVERPSPYFFTVGHTVDSQRKAVERFFEVNPEVKTASLLCWDDAWGNAHRQLFREVAEARGVKIVRDECTADFSNDYRVTMLKVKGDKSDALLLTTSLADVAFKATHDLGLTQKILTTSIVPDALELRDMPIEYVKNVWFTDWMPNENFSKRFKEKYGVYPILEAQNHYETMWAIARGLRSNPDNLLEGLKTVKFASEDIGGSIDFTRGDNIRVNQGEAKLYQAKAEGEYIEVK